MKESIVRLRALEKQRFAYRYALNAVSYTHLRAHET